MAGASTEKKFTVYFIYYGDTLMYVGRTKQRLQDRLRGHFFKKPYHRIIDLLEVSKIEYAEFDTEADMFLYEIYYINKHKPPLNCDDCAKDELTITLPQKGIASFDSPVLSKWRQQLKKQGEQTESQSEEYRRTVQEISVLRKRHKDGEIPEEDFWEQMSVLTDRRNQLKKVLYG